MCFGRGSSHALVRLIPLYGHVPTCRNGRNVALYLPYSLQTEFKCRSAGDCCLLSVCDTPYQHIAYHDTWISVVHHILPATGYASRSNFKRNRLSTISSDNSLSKFLIYIYMYFFAILIFVFVNMWNNWSKNVQNAFYSATTFHNTNVNPLLIMRNYRLLWRCARFVPTLWTGVLC